jgi:uncharacterized membrane protein
MREKTMGKSQIDKNAAKRAAVLGADKGSRKPLLATLAIAAVLVAAAAYVFVKKGGNSEAIAALAATDASAAEVSFPAKDFADGQAKFFKTDGGGGVTIRYYVVKAPDGSLKAALDACDACWHAGKGYEHAGADMLCRNCGRKFAIAKIGEVHGGCNPVALPSQLRNGNVVIQVKDILAGRRYFDLPKKG